MSDSKTSSSSSESYQEFIGETKEHGNVKYVLSKFEYDLYHEEDDIANKVVRVKRFTLPNKGVKWKVFEDSKAVFVIEGNKLSKKEREFLHTIDGINFVINQHKNGIKSLNALKKEIKKTLTSNKK